jgi:heat shock protein HtpX
MFRAFGLYTHIRNNRLRTLYLLVAFVVLIHAVLFSLLLLYEAAAFGGSVEEIVAAARDDLRYAWPVAIVACAVWFLTAWAFHQSMIDFATKAAGIERQSEPRLYNLLENLCISRGLPMPRLKIIETDGLNAFAAGLRRRNYSIAVTRGLLQSLDDRELQAVLGHELTHIRNKDTQVLVVAAIFAGILAFVGDVMFRGIDFPFGYSPHRGRGPRREGRGGGAAIIVLLAIAVIAVSWGASVLIRFAISRSREYLADAGSVELTKDPDAMISALRRIAASPEIVGMPTRMHAFFIESPAARPGSGWLSTHPSVEERVAALTKFAGGVDAPVAIAESPRGPWS